MPRRGGRGAPAGGGTLARVRGSPAVNYLADVVPRQGGFTFRGGAPAGGHLWEEVPRLEIAAGELPRGV